MKVVLCVLTVLVITVCVNCDFDVPPEMLQAFEECFTEMGMSYESLEKSNMNDHKMKCIKACTLKKQGRLVNGKMVPEKEIEWIMIMARKFKVDDNLTQKVTECTTIANKQTDECEVADAMKLCIKEKLFDQLHFDDHH